MFNPSQTLRSQNKSYDKLLNKTSQFIVGTILSVAASFTAVPAWASSFTAQVPMSETINPGSSVRYAPGEQIKWSANISPADVLVPQWQEHIVTFGAGQTYIAGQTKAPERFKAFYTVGGVESTTEPANGASVTKIRYRYDPTTASLSKPPNGSVNLSGGGDGYQIISYQDNVYVINHHISGRNIKCYSAITGNVCTGWAGGLAAGGTTVNQPLELLNRATGEMYFPMIKDRSNDAGFGCFNLKTATPCTTPFYKFGSESTFWNVLGMGAVGANIYAVNAAGDIWCLNTTTKQACKNTQPGNYKFTGRAPTPMFSGPITPGAYFNFTSGGAVHAPYLFVHDVGGRIHCFDSSTARPCKGSWPFAKNANTSRVLTKADGSFKAICYAGTSAVPVTFNNYNTSTPANLISGCADIEGVSKNYPNNLSKEYGWIGGAYMREITYNNKIYSVTPNSNVNCFDQATQAACSGFSMNRALGQDVYTIIADPDRPGCMWTNGDKGYAVSFDAGDGGLCKGGAGNVVRFTTTPALSYLCDPSSHGITGWKAIVFSGASTTGVQAKIFGGGSNTLLSTRTFAAGATSIDISDISYAQYPSLDVEITLTNGGSLANVFVDVLWNGAPRQFCSNTKTTKECTASALLNATSGVAGGNATNYSETLNAGLTQTALNNGWGVGSAISSLKLSDKPLLFRGTWDFVNLFGDVLVTRIDSSTAAPGTVFAKASTSLPAPASRNILTQKTDGTTTQFAWSNLDATQKASLNRNSSGFSDALGASRVDYLYGDNSLEKTKAKPSGVFRERMGPLGMVLNSALVYMPTAGVMGYSEASQPGYQTYASATGRKKGTLFMTANDGMLHAFTVTDTGSGASMDEQFAYMPKSLLGKMNLYTDGPKDALMANPYFIDNTPMVADIKRDGVWGTALVGAFGRGGKGLYALDVTAADKVTKSSANIAIREFTDADDADMGKIIAQPITNDYNYSAQIIQVKTPTGATRPAVIVGNGAQSTTNTAALFIIYLDKTGGHTKIKLGAASASPNGLATPFVVSQNGVAQRAYAGDLLGNMWVIDLNNVGAMTSRLLYKASQPINTAPAVKAFAPAGTCVDCYMVNFVTSTPIAGVLNFDFKIPQQTAYGVWDTNQAAVVPTSSLVPQAFDGAKSGAAFTMTKRTVIFDATPTSKKGWYLPLPAGEMAVANPFLRDSGAVVFFTIREPGLVAGMCSNISGSVYEIDAATANPLDMSIDINGDGLVNNSDLIITGKNADGTDKTSSAGGLDNIEAQRGPSQVLNFGSNSGGSGGNNTEGKVTASGAFVRECVSCTAAATGGLKRISWKEITQ